MQNQISQNVDHLVSILLSSFNEILDLVDLDNTFTRIYYYIQWTFSTIMIIII